MKYYQQNKDWKNYIRSLEKNTRRIAKKEATAVIIKRRIIKREIVGVYRGVHKRQL